MIVEPADFAAPVLPELPEEPEAPQPAKESTRAIRQITVVILRYLNLSFLLFNSVSITNRY